MHALWALLLPMAAASGWFAASSTGKQPDKKSEQQWQKDKSHALRRDYFQGVNFLLNEEPDKAIDVFVKMLELDSETVETHLALGNLFRRRGEVERAIRIHQNLIARPQLDRIYRSQALFALAKDYLSAGVLDRAERLFLELIDLGEHKEASLLNLLDIYQQEKEWKKAIEIAQRLGFQQTRASIAHYYCELADIELKAGNHSQASHDVKRALSADKDCVRASLLASQIEAMNGNHKQAIRYLKNIKNQDANFLSESIFPLVISHRAVSKERDLLLYFKDILREFPKVPIVIMLSEQIQQWRGDKAALSFVSDHVRKNPSIAGLHRLVELQLPQAEGEAKKDLMILQRLTEKILATQPIYRCVRCGFAGKILHWHCPSCKRWGSIKPIHALEE